MRRHRTAGFTLIETLCVVVVLGLLAGMLLPALAGAMRRAREAAVSAEMGGLNVALASFTLRYQQYPPSRFVCSESGDYSPAYLTASMADATEAIAQTPRTLSCLRTMFPRVAASTSGAPSQVPGIGFYDFNGNGVLDRPYVLHGDECLAFFLGGVPQPSGGKFAAIGFASDPKNPFQPGGYLGASGAIATPPRLPAMFEFDASRLVDLDGDGVPSYADIYSGSALPTPYAYFAAMGGSYDPGDVDFAVEPDGSPSPSCGFAIPFGGSPSLLPGRPDLRSSPAPNPYATGPVLPTAGAYESAALGTGYLPISWLASSSYQILCAGRDRQFGPGGWYDPTSRSNNLPFPYQANFQVAGTLPVGVNYRLVERDNIANFSSGILQP